MNRTIRLSELAAQFIGTGIGQEVGSYIANNIKTGKTTTDTSQKQELYHQGVANGQGVGTTEDNHLPTKSTSATDDQERYHQSLQTTSNKPATSTNSNSQTLIKPQRQSTPTFNDPNFNRTYADYLFNTRRITSTGYQLLLTSLSQGNAEFEAMLDTVITSANVPISTQPARRSTSTNTPPSPTFVPTRAQRWNAQTNQSSVGNNENNVWLERSHQGLEDASVVAGSKKYSNVLGGFWRGINNKWYDIRSNFWGNQYAGSKVNAINNFEMYDNIGKGAYVAGMFLGIYKIERDFSNHEYFTLSTGKNFIDLVMATIGETGPIGFAVFAAYTLGGNWVSAVKNTTKNITEQYEAATGEGVWASNSRIWMGYGE